MDNFEQRRLFPVVEATLPAITGLSRELIRTLREEILHKGADWVKAHRDILLTEAAVQKLLQAHAAIKTAVPHPSSPPAVNVAPAEPSAQAARVKLTPTNVARLYELRITRILPVNPKLLAASLAGSANTVHVRVQSNAFYTLGMTIYATRESPGLYTAHGRAPRYKGEQLYRDE